ncbi:hypothetical protein MTR67_030138 [Solanum verrucosum]|uniref:RNase H type-1 domain-containing protein n=1 Tax=Solanum verrucosum TaxID=315347 RepID=A0AAF0R9X2_SOLVR|nr:hypothetical protein MTR67_030138 [Solanum verrucosum]
MDFKAKLWGNLRTSSSLWGDYMKAKYLENRHPIKTQWSSSNSQNWKVFCEVKSLAEQHIYWKITKKKFGKANTEESWRNIHYILDAEIHHKTTTIVKCIKPPNMYVKLNSDGSCIQGHCGGGGLIRNSLGNLVFAYCINWNLARVTSQKWQLFFMALNGVLIEASLMSGLKQTPCC